MCEQSNASARSSSLVHPLGRLQIPLSVVAEAFEQSTPANSNSHCRESNWSHEPRGPTPMRVASRSKQLRGRDQGGRGFMKIRFAINLASTVILTSLSGCGLYVPEKDLLHPNDIDPRNGMSRQGKIESNIIANIRCEITKGVYRALATGNVPWLAGWGASVSLNLTWEEQGSVNPGINYTTPFGRLGETFTVAAGLSSSAKATRTEAITFTLENRVLLKEAMLTARTSTGLDCSLLEEGWTVQSNLKIDEFIYDKASVAGGHGARTRPIDYPQFSTFQETITFVVTVGGTATPSWKFIRLTVNPGGEFLSASRIKTSQIIITFGPLAQAASRAGPAELAVQSAVQHQAAIIGGSTAAAIISQSR